MRPLDVDELRAALGSDDNTPIGEVRTVRAETWVVIVGPLLIRENQTLAERLRGAIYHRMHALERRLAAMREDRMDTFTQRRRRANEERIARKLGVHRADLGLTEWPNTDNRYAAHCALHEIETRLMEVAALVRHRR